MATEETKTNEYKYNEPVYYEWVTGFFEGEQAKRVRAHANAGSTYKILKDNNNKINPAILAAFIRPLIGPRPHHLTEVTDRKQIAELEKWYRGDHTGHN